MEKPKYKIIRYYHSKTEALDEDVIVRYWYSANDKKYLYEKSWSYEDIRKRESIVGVLNVVDEIFNMLQPDAYYETAQIYSLPFEKYEKGADLDD